MPSWFAEPLPLTSDVPSELTTTAATSSSAAVPPHRDARPPVLDVAAAPKKRRAPAAGAEQRVAEKISLLVPETSCRAPGEAIDRWRAVVDGRKCAVPHRLSDFEGEEQDGEEELLVVELRDAYGSPGWLEDRALDSVYHEGTDTLFSLSALRRLVQKSVVLQSNARPPRMLRRNVYKVCEPLTSARLLVAVVPVSALRDLPLVSGEDPPLKRSA